MDNNLKTGYLDKDFKFFHLKGKYNKKFDFHYHEFCKIIILLNGDIIYKIQGESYNLKKYDIVLVNSMELHKPEILNNSTYERIIIYISPNLILNLNICFLNATSEKSHVLRIPSFEDSKLYSLILELENSLINDEFAKDFYNELLLLQFIININRASISNNISYIETSTKNSKINEILDYINNNFTKNLSCENLSNTFFINRYYLMHLFKSETGFTINNYITIKRVQYAKKLISRGIKITDAAYSAGFNNYSTFSRAYKKIYKKSPKDNK